MNVKVVKVMKTILIEFNTTAYNEKDRRKVFIQKIQNVLRSIPVAL